MPRRRGRPVRLDDLPRVRSAANLGDTMAAITTATAGGAINLTSFPSLTTCHCRHTLSETNCPFFYGTPAMLTPRNGNPFLDVYRAPSNSQVIVMILKTSIRLGFAAACLTAIATMPAHAAIPSPQQNVIQSKHYTRLLETNRAFREARMRKECGPITDPQLHQQCLASFQEYSPVVASAASPRRVASSGHHVKHYVGSSTAPRHYQSQSGK